MELTTNARLYNQYLALDRAIKRLEYCGGQVSRWGAGMDRSYGEDYWRGTVERELDEGEVPNLYRFADLQIYLKDQYEDDYDLTLDQRQEKQQEHAEEVIRKMVDKYPGVIAARYDNGEAVLYWDEPNERMGVTINMGKALCTRVLVGEDVSMVPDPALLAEVPKVQKVTPRYEWRCNDAELFDNGIPRAEPSGQGRG